MYLWFCDDLGLLSHDQSDLQELLAICEQYANDWGLEFNIPKCKIMLFGSKKQLKQNNAIFILNGEEISYTDKFKYLGLEFTYYMDMSCFFISKFQNVSKSFYSLSSFVFKPGGVNPYLQAYIYKYFCLSPIWYRNYEH